MCIGVPVQIVEISDNDALGEIDGVQQRINIDLVPEVKEGDFVLLHAGCAVQILNKREAKKNIRLMNRIIKGKTEKKG